MMRRCRFKAVTIREFGNRTRSGLSVRTAPSVQMAISPLSCSSVSNGFAPSRPVKAGITRSQMPTPTSTVKANSLCARIFTNEFIRSRGSKILAQVHSGVEMGGLLLVTIEHQRRLLAGEKATADHPLARLAPARVIDIRIHVRIETVFARRKLVPGCFRLVGHKLNLHERFRALESIFPWNHQANRRAVLVAQRPAVEARREKRKFVHRFRQCESFSVRPR